MDTNLSVSLHVRVSIQYILAVKILTKKIFFVTYTMVKSHVTFYLRMSLFLVSI